MPAFFEKSTVQTKDTLLFMKVQIIEMDILVWIQNILLLSN